MHAEALNGVQETVGIADAGEGGDLARASIGPSTGDQGNGIFRGVVESSNGRALLENAARADPLREQARGEIGELWADLFAAGEHDHVGAFEVEGGLAPGPAGEDAGDAEGLGGVDEHDVEIAREAAVLEAIIEDEHIRSRRAFRWPRGRLRRGQR